MAQALGYLKKLFDDGVLLPLQQSAGFGIRIAENPKWVNGQGAMYLEFTTHFIVAKGRGKGSAYHHCQITVMDNAKQTGIMITPAQLLFDHPADQEYSGCGDLCQFFPE